MQRLFQTYFLNYENGAENGLTDRASLGSLQAMSFDEQAAMRTQRLVQWNVRILSGLIRPIIAHRAAKKKPEQSREKIERQSHITSDSSTGDAETPLSEVKEIFTLPEFCSKTAHIHRDAQGTEVDIQVTQQLESYVAGIASKYRNNPFHNFAHVSFLAALFSTRLTLS